MRGSNAEAVGETAIVERQGGGYVAMRSEIDFVSPEASAEMQDNSAKAPSPVIEMTPTEQADERPRVGAPRLSAHRSSLPCAGFEWWPP